ncbi:hypothetical protein ACLKA7_012879 [Drosophila subpalustris]
MEPNITININVNSNPVSTGTLDLQKIVDELRRECNVMKAERGRERTEMDALRQEGAELNSRVSALEAARKREAGQGFADNAGNTERTLNLTFSPPVDV